MTPPPRRAPGRARHAAPRSAASDPARLAAYEVLSGVADRDAYANLLLPSVLKQRNLAGRNAALATELAGTRLKLGPLASLDAGDGAPLAPGELAIQRSRVLVGTGSSPVELGEVQPHGKRPMVAAAWARGLRLAEPARLA